MKMLELLRVAIIALRVNLLRSILTMLGIVIGVSCVITMVTVSAGAQEQIDRQMESLGSNLLMIYSSSRRRGGVQQASGGRASLNESDAEALKAEIPNIVAAAPSISEREQLVSGSDNWNARIYAMTADFMVARNWKVKEGRPISADEFNRGERVLLMGQTIVESMFGASNVIGQTVRVRNVPFTIVGTLERKGSSSNGWDQDDVVLVPIKTARTRLMGRSGTRGNSVEYIYVTVRESWMMPDVEQQASELLRQRHRVPFDADDPFTIRNMSEMYETQLEAQNVFNYLLSAIASVSLLVGGIGIMNIMLVSVTERTREIGLRMALGARSRDIMLQFLVEAVVLCIGGGAIGIGVAMGASYGIAELAKWPVLVQTYVILLAIVFSGCIGIFFGFYPARKAAAKDPIDALRTE